MMANQVKTVVGKTLSSLGTFQVRTSDCGANLHIPSGPAAKAAQIGRMYGCNLASHQRRLSTWQIGGVHVRRGTGHEGKGTIFGS